MNLHQEAEVWLRNHHSATSVPKQILSHFSASRCSIPVEVSMHNFKWAMANLCYRVEYHHQIQRKVLFETPSCTIISEESQAQAPKWVALSVEPFYVIFVVILLTKVQ